MILGLVLILAGILIAVVPEMLSLIVAGVLIFWGISFVYMSFYFKRASRKFNDPFIDFFFRL